MGVHASPCVTNDTCLYTYLLSCRAMVADADPKYMFVYMHAWSRLRPVVIRLRAVPPKVRVKIMEPGGKRAKTGYKHLTSMMLPHATIAKALQSARLDGVAGEAEPSRYSLHRAAQAGLDEDTPYGKLIEDMELELTDGTTFTMPYINPFALVFYMNMLSVACRGFLRLHLQGRTARVCLYVDETTPGNVLRPDKGRSLQCVYWTFLEFPSWFRVKTTSWFAVCYLPSSVVQKLAGGMSALMARILRIFWHPTSWNFKRLGVRMRLGERMQDAWQLHATFACWVSDEKAFKELCNVKGASGTKPCLQCKNVIGRVGRGDVMGNYLVHVTEPDRTKFDPHTPDSFLEMVSSLSERVEAHAPSKEVKELEQMYGLTYNLHALPWDAYIMQNIVQIPVCVYWDSMHVLHAAGGVAQYECNQVVNKLLERGISLDNFDMFKEHVVHGMNKVVPLSRTFFKDRMCSGSDTHMKALAGETFLVIEILALFLATVVEPIGELLDVLRCFNALRIITEILKKGDAAVLHVAKLEATISEHHYLFLRLYPDCAKPKLHDLQHIPQCLARFQRNLNCFTTERKHREAKRIADDVSVMGNLSRTVLQRQLSWWAQQMELETFEETVMEKPKLCPLAASWFADWGDVVSCNAASKLQYRMHAYNTGDILVFEGRVVETVLFFSVVFAQSACPRYVACCLEYTPTRPAGAPQEPATSWAKGTQHVLVCMDLVTQLTYLKEGSTIRPLFPLAT